MTVPAVSSTQNTPNPDTVQTVTQKTLGQDDFLKLLAAQLTAQDPMQPTDNTQFISQMASFSSLQQMSTLNTHFTSFANTQQAASAPQYLGKQVTVTDANGAPYTGVATAFSVSNGVVSLTVGDSDYPLDAVTKVAVPNL